MHVFTVATRQDVDAPAKRGHDVDKSFYRYFVQ